MGFLSGLANTIGTAGPIAAQIGGDYEQAQAQGSGQRNQQALQMLMLQRQQRQQEIENALHVAQTGEAQAHGAQFQHEAQKLQPGDAGYVPMMGQLAGAEAYAKLAPELQLAVQKGQIDLNNATAIQNLTHQNKTQEIGQEGDIKSALQTNQQAATAKQNTLNRTATSSNQAASQSAAAARIGQTQSGEVVPSLVHGAKDVAHMINPANWFTAPSPSHSSVAPSTAPNPQQSAWDSAAQHLQKTQPNIDPSAVLGARP